MQSYLQARQLILLLAAADYHASAYLSIGTSIAELRHRRALTFASVCTPNHAGVMMQHGKDPGSSSRSLGYVQSASDFSASALPPSV